MAQSAEPIRVWYSPEEVQEILGFGRTKTYELLRAGVIKGVKLGGEWRIPASEVDPDTIFLRLRSQAAEQEKIRKAGVSHR